MNSPLQCCAQITYLKEKSFSDHASALLTLLSSNNFSFCTSNANVSFSLSLKGRGTKSVILNSFQDLSFPQSIPHPSPLLLRRGNSIIVRSTVTDYSLFTFLSLFTHLFAPVLDLLHADGGGKTDWARGKVCHPELVSGSKLSQSIPHPSPLLLRRGNSIIVRSTVTDYSLFTFLSLFTHLFAPSPVLRTPSPNREREN